VHDAFLKVRSHAAAQVFDSVHLKARVTRAKRQIPVDHARSARAGKHAGAQRPVTLEGVEAGGGDRFDLVAVDAALRELDGLDPRCAKVVELHVFGGLTMPEIADLLQLAERTVFRDWRKARAILVDRLG
jgi:RNA polymerase sigma factor (TIGR02999 family)